MQDIHQRLLAIFQVEHRDHVEQIRSFLAMGANAGAPPSRADLEEVFRRAHSLKGAARAVDLRSIEELAHRLETLFSRILHGTCALDANTSRVAQQVLDASEDSIAAGSSSQPDERVRTALLAIESVLGIQPEPAAQPAMEAQAPVPVPVPVSVAVAVSVPVPAFQPIEMVRITAENFEGLFRTAGSLIAESRRQDQVAEELDLLARDIALIEKESDRARRAVEAQGRSGTSHELSRLASLLGSVGHRARSVSRRTRSARRMHQHRRWSLRQLGKQLQRDVWQARMIPAESLLEGYRKMMRDLAHDEGKGIEFRATSAGVNADRRVLEALKDPIMHLLRNAVSHGIEPASERRAKGKQTTGTVTLRVDTDGQRLTVTVEDDGRGVDLARVAEVAAQEGIPQGSSTAPRSERELIRFLFRAGFSTSPAVTSLSGRGMGLSVVYEAVRRLQGDVDLRGASGGGTIVSLSAPLSIASHRLMIVSCATQMFAIPVSGIERLLRIRRSGVETMEGRPAVVFNGQPVPLTGVHALLGLEELPLQSNTDALQIVILKCAGKRIGLAVDAVVREADAVTQDLSYAIGCGGKITSGVVLDDGGIAFVINPMELSESAFQTRAHWLSASVLKSREPVTVPVPSNILVVDDSMTTRALEKGILEAHGYVVRIAVDGVDALARLREEKADLVIADIEMPRLNGFGLIEAMKKDAQLERIPVIIVSSVDRREDQERGLALGADAYVIKQKFDQQELLATIRQII